MEKQNGKCGWKKKETRRKRMGKIKTEWRKSKQMFFKQKLRHHNNDIVKAQSTDKNLLIEVS